MESNLRRIITTSLSSYIGGTAAMELRKVKESVSTVEDPFFVTRWLAFADCS